jgi:hypothetical protein
MTADTALIALIAQALFNANGNVKQAAELAGLSRTTFRRQRDANNEAVKALLDQYAAAADQPEIAVEPEIADQPAQCAYQAFADDPAIRVCVTHNPEFGLYGDELCAGEHIAAADDDNHDSYAGFTDPPAPKAARQPAGALNPAARKRVVAQAVIKIAADLAATWEHDEITPDEAITLIASWMNYLPGGVWDARLGARSGAGRRAK